MDDGLLIEEIHGGHDAILEFLFRRDANVAQDGAGELGEEALDEIEPGAVGGREGEFEAVRRLACKPGSGFLGNVCGMIVEDQLDRGIGRIGGVEKLEKFDEFATAMAIPDQRMDLATDKIDTGQQADRAVALVFILPREARMQTGDGRQVGGGGRNRLDAGLLIIGDDRHRFAGLFFAAAAACFKICTWR